MQVAVTRISFSSKEEGTKGDEQSLTEGLLLPKEDETPEKEQYLEEEENYLKGDNYQFEQDYPYEQDHWGHKDLPKKELLEGKMFLYKKFLEAAFVPSEGPQMAENERGDLPCAANTQDSNIHPKFRRRPSVRRKQLLEESHWLGGEELRPAGNQSGRDVPLQGVLCARLRRVGAGPLSRPEDELHGPRYTDEGPRVQRAE
ncbi:hypothetical protein MG293_010950 [Ovis ammon polii]|uniref:Uncharacterized protein n=1 Tax=Ovis ammon polii TaxID=230172 RepID=A0AAD4U1M4_OVIAM|nr:hypothetical protein MG293_010950 [Ovis ammon polii]